MDAQREPDVAALPKPWLRLTAKSGKAGTRESAKAYAGFQFYYLASPNLRSLRQVALQLTRSEILMERSRSFDWVRRTEAWDRHQSQLAAAECGKTRRENDAEWTDQEEDLYELQARQLRVRDHAAMRPFKRSLDVADFPGMRHIKYLRTSNTGRFLRCRSRAKVMNINDIIALRDREIVQGTAPGREGSAHDRRGDRTQVEVWSRRSVVGDGQTSRPPRQRTIH